MLKRHFAKYGKIESVQIIGTKTKSERKCMITFSSIDSAIRCFEAGVKKTVTNKFGFCRELLCKPCNRKKLQTLECKVKPDEIKVLEEEFIDAKFQDIYREFFSTKPLEKCYE